MIQNNEKPKPPRKASNNHVTFTNQPQNDSTSVGNRLDEKTKTEAEESEVVATETRTNRSDIQKGEASLEDLSRKKKERIEAEREYEHLRLHAQEMMKKNHGLWTQVKHIFSRKLLRLVILNYAISMGVVTACGGLAGEIYARFGLSAVSNCDYPNISHFLLSQIRWQ